MLHDETIGYVPEKDKPLHSDDENGQLQRSVGKHQQPTPPESINNKPPLPPEGNPTTSENNPYNERLIKSAEASIIFFFDQASRSHGIIKENEDELKRSGRYLDDSSYDAMQTARNLDDEDQDRDYRVEEIRSNILKIKQNLEDQTDRLNNILSNASRGSELLGYIWQENKKWMRGGDLEAFTEELRDAVNEPDKAIKDEMLSSLLDRVLTLCRKIDSEGSDISSRITNSGFDVTNNRSDISNRVDETTYLIERSRDKFPESYYSIKNGIDSIYEGVKAFYIRTDEPLQYLPFEYKKLSDEADRLGSDMKEIFGLIQKGEKKEPQS